MYQTQPWPSLPQQVVGTGILRLRGCLEVDMIRYVRSSWI